MVTDVGDDTFESEVLKADKPVLVDFWAPWCGPCKALTPLIDALAEEYADRLKVVKVNIDEAQGTAPKYGVRGIPTLSIFINSEVECQMVGVKSKVELKDFIDKALGEQTDKRGEGQETDKRSEEQETDKRSEGQETDERGEGQVDEPDAGTKRHKP